MANAQHFNDHPVVAIKNAKVSDFAHKSLNANEESYVFYNPDLDRARELRKWYDELEKEKYEEFHALSEGTGLESMMKEPQPDETLHRFCNNPEDSSNK